MTGSGNEIAGGRKDLQLRVQLRIRTGFPFTNRLPERKRLHLDHAAKIQIPLESPAL